ncbi:MULTISPECIES: hypothetical protein [Rhodonellum]|nr:MULTISPECIES: hypothetical protein [Rhodonellum]SDZ20367.1 hypothetical protein SAMN05444412_107175 [Rhodonellum ikkaensis]
MDDFLNIGKGNVIMACHMTGIYDVNRNTVLPDDAYALIKDWADSIIDLNLKGIVFHNNFSDQTCAEIQGQHIQFIKVNHDTRFTPNVYRYFLYRDFIQQHFDELLNVFVTDITDVVVLKDPFQEPIFTGNPQAIFCGDEPKPLLDDWMLLHAAHLRSKISDYQGYEEEFKEATLLNCGIIGGNVQVMQLFLSQLCSLHEKYNSDNKTAYTGDMGAFNYLVRTEFNDRVIHGTPVNTVFKEYEAERKDCWFRHK